MDIKVGDKYGCLTILEFSHKTKKGNIIGELNVNVEKKF